MILKLLLEKNRIYFYVGKRWLIIDLPRKLLRVINLTREISFENITMQNDILMFEFIWKF